MVVWVFSGGGEAELQGLILFLEKNFTQHRFERKTPIKPKPGPRPGINALGKTGVDLEKQINYYLPLALNSGSCEFLLVLDDLDCHSLEQRSQFFKNAVMEIMGDHQSKILTVFASPEIEAWLVADWDNSFKKDIDLGKYEVNIRRELIQKYNQSNPNQYSQIDYPESFSFLDTDKNTCHQKLSEIIRDIVLQVSGIHFSKKEHSGRMLKNISASRVCERCPSARDLLKLSEVALDRE